MKLCARVVTPFTSQELTPFNTQTLSNMLEICRPSYVQDTLQYCLTRDYIASTSLEHIKNVLRVYQERITSVN